MKGPIIVQTLKCCKYLDSEAISLVCRTFKGAPEPEKVQILSEIDTQRKVDLSRECIGVGACLSIAAGTLFAGGEFVPVVFGCLGTSQKASDITTLSKNSASNEGVRYH